MMKLMVFDWNGTLLADTRACMAADNHVINTFGGRAVDLKTYRETVCIPSLSFYLLHGCRREMIEADPVRFRQVFHTFYEARVAKVRTRTGAKEVLTWLQEKQIRSIILSNHTIVGIETQLQRLGLRPYLAEVLANPDKQTAMLERNKERKLAEYMEKYGCNPAEVAIIGDSPEEVEIGRHLGIQSIALTNGYYSTARLRASKPPVFITHLRDLIPVLQKSVEEKET